MKRLRLAILGDSPCFLCTAACCKQNGHDYAALLQTDAERRKFAPFAAAVPIADGGRITVENVLPYVNGRCTFLGDDDLCTIYEDRPRACRQFQCVSGYLPIGTNPTGHDEFLRRNPAVRRMLDEL